MNIMKYLIAKFGKKHGTAENLTWMKYLCMDHNQTRTFALSLVLPDHSISSERILAKQTGLVSMQMRIGGRVGNRNDNNDTQGRNNYNATLSVVRTFEDVVRL